MPVTPHPYLPPVGTTILSLATQPETVPTVSPSPSSIVSPVTETELLTSVASAVVAARVLGAGAEVGPEVPTAVIRAVHGVDFPPIDDTHAVLVVAPLYLTGAVVHHALVCLGDLVCPIVQLVALDGGVELLADREGLAWLIGVSSSTVVA